MTPDTNQSSHADALASALDRLRRKTGTAEDIELLGEALKQRSITVSGARGVGIGTAQDSVIITGNDNKYRHIELTFNGPHAGTIRMAIGRARLLNINSGNSVPKPPEVPPPRFPMGSIAGIFAGLFLCSNSIGWLSADPFFREGGGGVFLGFMGLLGSSIIVYSGKRIVTFRNAPMRRFACHVVDKRENGTVGYYLMVEEVDQSRHQISAKRDQGDQIATGDVGLVDVKVNTLMQFKRIEFD